MPGKAPGSMLPNYEYKWLTTNYSPESMEYVMNRFGYQGWRVVQLKPETDAPKVGILFERPRE